MIDIQKQIFHWRDSAQEDWRFAGDLIEHGERLHYGLFFIHLALGKVMKAHYCKNAREIPPRIHNLITLASLASISLSPEYEEMCIEFNTFNIRGRYPDLLDKGLTHKEAREYYRKAREVFEWLMKQL